MRNSYEQVTSGSEGT